jgi:hypothetical protein
MIGSGVITSFDQGTKPANVVSDIYDEVLKTLLASGKWKFASTRVQLAKSSTAPATEFDNAFVLPADWIRTISVSNNDVTIGNVMYKHGQVGSQNVLESSSEDLFLNYVRFEEDPNLMTALFRNAFTIALARDMAVPLANSNTLEEQLAKKARVALGRAMAVDSMGSFPVNRPRGSWVTSRFRSHNSVGGREF